MAGTNLDANAKQGSRVRRNWARVNKGGASALVKVAAPLVINSSQQLALQTDTAGGLTVVSTKLLIKLDSTPGLVLASTGIKVLLDPTNPCLQLTSGLKVTVNATGAITQTTTGLQVAVDGTTLEINTNAIRVKDGSISLAKLGALTTKGDLLTFHTAAHQRLPVGLDGALLVADSSVTAGIKWAKRRVGTATLVAGTVTVNDASITASTVILLTAQNSSGTPGFVGVSARSAGASFTITSSSALDTSLIGYELIEP